MIKLFLQGSIITQATLGGLIWPANYISSRYKFSTVYMCQQLWQFVAESRQSYCSQKGCSFFRPPCMSRWNRSQV